MNEIDIKNKITETKNECKDKIKKILSPIDVFYFNHKKLKAIIKKIDITNVPFYEVIELSEVYLYKDNIIYLENKNGVKYKLDNLISPHNQPIEIDLLDNINKEIQIIKDDIKFYKIICDNYDKII